MLRYGGSALRKPHGRYLARSSDRLPRDLYLYESSGKFTGTTRSSKAASLIGKYHNAVHNYVAYGDAAALDLFEGQSVILSGKRYYFLTNHTLLNKLARAGDLHVLDIYSYGEK